MRWAAFPPATSIRLSTGGLATAGRFSWNAVPDYVIAQVAGGIVGALVLYLIASGKPDFSVSGGR